MIKFKEKRGRKTRANPGAANDGNDVAQHYRVKEISCGEMEEMHSRWRDTVRRIWNENGDLFEPSSVLQFNVTRRTSMRPRLLS